MEVEVEVTQPRTAGYRSSRSQMFFKIGVLKNFAIFTGKHLCCNLFFNKVAGLRYATLLKKETLSQVFSCEYCNIFKNTYFEEHPRTDASVACCSKLSFFCNVLF